MNLTVLIITKNAEATLQRTLMSVRKLNCTLIIIDDFSSDRTTRIARHFGCKIISHHADGFELQRTFALSIPQTEWTLVLDSDEVLTINNIEEIQSAINSKEFNGFYLHYRNHLFGKKISNGELHRKLTLFKTSKVKIQPFKIHEQCIVEGKKGELPSEIYHYSYLSLSHVIKKFFNYSKRIAKEYKEAKKTYNWKHLILYPLHMFYARFIKDQGYKDGPARLFLDLQFAQMEFLSYFLIPFVNARDRIAVDCGSYAVGTRVQSGIERLLQGIYATKSALYDYYWFSYSSSSPNRLPRRFFSQLWLPLKTIISRCDVFLGTGGTIPWLLQFFPVKKILFLYDFGFITSPDKYGASANRLKSQTDSSIRIADKIVFLHGAIYSEFITLYPQFAHKAVVVPSGADHLVDIEAKPVFIQKVKPLILYVGVVKPVKRIDKLISAVGDNYCVIAGPQEEEYKRSLQIGKTQNIQFIQNLEDGQLKWLYKHADVLVYTSEHEGFCYPVLEALTLGTPVVALDLPLFRTYQKYFPHLTLVETEKQLKGVLAHMPPKPSHISTEHPYKWGAFTDGVAELWKYTRAVRPVGKKFAFIVVLYKTPQQDKKRLEEEIKKIGVADYEIYWIDNSTNGRGYAAGINEGIRQGLIDGCEQFVALNPDISLSTITAEALTKVTAEFDVWGFAMKQNNVIYYGGELDKWRLSGGLVGVKPTMELAEVDFISGSVMGFSRDVVQTIGLWDESYFMYYEDVDYCVRAKRMGYQVGIDTQTVYDHFEVSQLNKKKEKWIAKSRWKFFWKYSNVTQKVREIARLPKTLFHI